MTPKWTGQSKGSPLGYRIFIFTIKSFGLGTAYRLLYLISYFFYLKATVPRNHLVNFYVKALDLDHKKAKKLARKNFYLFGSTLIDKFALAAGHDKKITLYSHDNHLIKPLIQDPNRGLLLISAHIGNWEIAGSLLKTYGDKTINIVLVDNEKGEIKKIEEKYKTKNINVIPMSGDMSHIFKITAALNKKEIVCMHGDRFIAGAKTYNCHFFDHECLFPQGPFQIGTKLKVPTAFVFNVKANKFQYEFYSSVPEVFQDPKEMAQVFVNHLEEKTKAYPEQWFNYYDYFSKESE